MILGTSHDLSMIFGPPRATPPNQHVRRRDGERGRQKRLVRMATRARLLLEREQLAVLNLLGRRLEEPQALKTFKGLPGVAGIIAQARRAFK